MADVIPSQLDVDVEFLTAHPRWQNEEKRREYIREVAVKSRDGMDPKHHAAVIGELWNRVDSRGAMKKVADFVGTAVKEVAASVPASGGAAALAITDAVGLTDSGSGTRMKRGAADLWDAAGQRIKSFHPNDRQEQRDKLLDSLKQDLDEGNAPEGFERWLAGEYDGLDKEKPDEETQQWITAVTEGLGRAAVMADHGGDLDPQKLKDYLAGDRNPGSVGLPEFGPGPRQMLADYVATRDPESWAMFTRRVSEGDSAHYTRLARHFAEQEYRSVMGVSEEGAVKGLMERSADMQTSLPDMASAWLPFMRGAKALQAARGGAGRAVLEATKGAVLEGGQEALTEALTDPLASNSQILEAGGMGLIGGGVVTATGAGLGVLMNRGNGPAAAPASPEVERQGEGVLAQLARRKVAIEAQEAGIGPGISQNATGDVVMDPEQGRARSEPLPPELADPPKVTVVEPGAGAAGQAPLAAAQDGGLDNAAFSEGQSVPEPALPPDEIIQGDPATDAEFLQKLGEENQAVFTPANNPGDGQSAAERVAGALGLRVAWFEAPERYEGSVDHTTGTVFLNVKHAGAPALKLVGHETVHFLKEAHPDLYAPLLPTLKEAVRVPEFETWLRKRGYTGLFQEEMLAHVAGDFALDKDFWTQVFKDKPGVGQQILAKVIEFIDWVRSNFSYAQQLKGKARTGATQFARTREKLGVLRGQLAEAYGELGRRAGEGGAGSPGKGPAPMSKVLPLGERSPQAGDVTKERSWGMRFRKDPAVREEIKQRFGVQRYVPVPNVQTLEEANGIIEQQGLLGAAMMTMDDQVGMPVHVRVMLAGQVVKRLNTEAIAAVQRQNAAYAAELFDLATEVALAKNELGTAVGRAVQAFAAWERMTPEGVLLDFEERVREVNTGTMPTLPEDFVKDVGELMDDINSLPEGSIWRADKMRELLTHLGRYEGIPIQKLAWAYWYGNVLSGLATHGVNAAASGIELFSRSMALTPTVRPEETVQLWKGMIGAFPRAVQEAWGVLRHNDAHPKVKDKYEAGSELDQLWAMREHRFELSIDPKQGWVIRGRERKSGKVKAFAIGSATLGRFVLRLLTATDAYFWRTGYEGMSRLAAARYGRSEAQAQGKPIGLYVAEQLHNSSTEMEQALAQADAEYLAAHPGKPVPTRDRQRRAWEILDSKRPEDVRNEAERFASLATFANPPEGAMGYVARALNGLIEGITLPLAPGLRMQLLRFMVPFVNIGCNILNSQLDYTGYGIVRAWAGSHLAADRDKKFSDLERRHRAGAGVIGLGVMATVALKALQYKDDEDPPFWIYGLGPSNAAERQMLRERGWKPYSIKIGNNFYSFAETPFALGLATVGGMLDYIRFKKENYDEADWSSRLAVAMLQAPGSMTQMGIFRTLGDILELADVSRLGDAEKTKERSMKFLMRPLGGYVPGQGVLRDLTKVFDPVNRKPVTAIGQITVGIPFLNAYGTEEVIDWRGNVKHISDMEKIPGYSRFITSAPDDPEMEWLVSQGLRIPYIGDTVNAGWGASSAVDKSQYKQAQRRRAEELGQKYAGMLTREEVKRYRIKAGEETVRVVKQVRAMQVAGQLSTKEAAQTWLDRGIRKAHQVAKKKIVLGYD